MGKRGPPKGSHYGAASIKCNKKANPDCKSKNGMCKSIDTKTGKRCIPTAKNRAGGK